MFGAAKFSPSCADHKSETGGHNVKRWLNVRNTRNVSQDEKRAERNRKTLL